MASTPSRAVKRVKKITERAAKRTSRASSEKRVNKIAKRANNRIERTMHRGNKRATR